MLTSSEEADVAAACKRRVRAAHRSLVTKLLNQVDATIKSSNTRALKQLRQSLSNEQNIPSKLDDKIIEPVNAEEIRQPLSRRRLALL